MFVVCQVKNGRVIHVHPNPYTVYSDAIACARKLGYEHCGKFAGVEDFNTHNGCEVRSEERTEFEFTVFSLEEVCID